MSSFAQLLREHRLAVGFSQEELAERAGLSVKTIGALERGERRRPYRWTIGQLAGALQLSHSRQAEMERAAARSSSFEATDVPSEPQSDNLPNCLSEFVGREATTAAIEKLVANHRLVTLVGAGGIGKTRLAVHVAVRMKDAYRDGAWFVDFASVGDVASCSSEIALALSVPGAHGPAAAGKLVSFLKSKQLLLILDNCEHLVGGVARIAEAILQSCAQVAILATSREAFAVGGERIYHVPPLDVPAAHEVPNLSVEGALAYGAIALFALRAVAADSRFVLTQRQLPFAASVCRQLDGIALAIEIAAARTRAFSLMALEKQVKHALSLEGGSRTTTARHRTMRALFDWSYRLLGDREQSLLRKLSVFVGGFTPELAASMCANEEMSEHQVFDIIGGLVDRSLLQKEIGDDVIRYRLLELTRQYAREKLRERAEVESTLREHAIALVTLAERFDPSIDLVPDRVWTTHVRPEVDNWRSALQWAFGPDGDLSIGRRLAVSRTIGWFGQALGENHRWIRTALESCDETTPVAVHANLQLASARAAAVAGRSESSQALAAAERALCNQDPADPLGIAEAQYYVGLALITSRRLTEGEHYMLDTLEAARSAGAQRLIALATDALGTARLFGGDLRGATHYYREALSLYRSAGCERLTAREAINLAEVAFERRDNEAALQLAEEAISIFRGASNPVSLAGALCNHSAYLIAMNRFETALDSTREAIAIARNSGFSVPIAWALQRVAAIAALRGTLPSLAAGLLGFVDARLREFESPRQFTERQEYERVVPVLRDVLGPEVDALMAEGGRWSEDRAISEARAID
jgi:predicted ATPase/DNA-binding XRE family transcriptional regulator